MNQELQAPAVAAPSRRGLPRVEAACLWFACACLTAMLVMILVEVVSRSLFRFSFEVSDEVGGYLTVALSFLALAPAQARKAFHNVALVHGRLSASVRRRCNIVFLVLSLACALAILAASARYVYRSWQQGDVASTVLHTPLWIPQAVMVVGMLALCWVLLAELLALVRSRARPDSSHVS